MMAAVRGIAGATVIGGLLMAVTVIAPSSTAGGPLSGGHAYDQAAASGAGSPGQPAVTILTARPAISVVAVVTSGCCTSQLMLKAKGRRWRVVTPWSGRRPNRVFESASFPTARIGWVSVWNVLNEHGIIYRTLDGGRSWKARPSDGHGAHAGAITVIDALSARVAFRTTLDPVAFTDQIDRTTDGGRHWVTEYADPPNRPRGRTKEPYQQLPVFTSRSHGFSADGVPPSDSEMTATKRLFVTYDAGRRWQRIRIPLAARCASRDTDPQPCPIGEPTFASDGSGVLGYALKGRHATTVGFDTTSDGGGMWRAAGKVRVRPRNGSYPMLSTPTRVAWWVAVSHRRGVTVWRTTNRGRRFTSVRTSLPGIPTQLAALGARSALLVVHLPGGNGARRPLYLTSDGGRIWRRVTAVDGR